MKGRRGRVALVGAGPGDPGLITLKGLRRLRRADVVVYDRLIGPRLIGLARADAERIDVGKAPGELHWEQEQINALIVERAQRGQRVVRLKGGDPFMFGRGGEELAACADAGVLCEVIPGVTSALAAPESIGVSVTHRPYSDSVAIITGRSAGSAGPPGHDYAALAKIDALVVLMGRASIRDIARELIRHGRDPRTPVAAIESATTTRQRHVLGALNDIADRLDEFRVEAPVVIVAGEVARMAERFAPLLDQTSRKGGKRRPLQGRRVAVTRAASSSDELFRLLRRAGAEVVPCPLIRTSFPASAEGADRALGRLAEFDGLAFTSMHGVDGFWRRLEHAGLDTRSLSRLKIGAIGPGTASALASRGVRADVMPEKYNGQSLAEAMLRAAEVGGCPTSTTAGMGGPRILCPRGNLARTELEAILKKGGAHVEVIEVYHTDLVEPPPSAVAELRRGVDAILFCSPSAVRQFSTLQLPRGRALLGCLGPTTGRMLTECDLPPDLVPDSSDVHSLVSELVKRLTPSEARA
ncbi:MAG: uroporphyrinogen-III C-methyltransferase [Phycisphaerales bacterium]|nr:uroporphyrinogen-III C-methyltransferase [Phycisphaerales bacterium]